jgi:hypothetical protein
MALVPFLFVLAGQLILPHARRTIHVWFNPIVLGKDGEFYSVEPGVPVGRLSGKVLVYSHFRQWHDFRIETHRFFLLGAVGTGSLAGMWFATQAQIDFFAGAVFYYLMLFGWVAMVGLARRWFWERRMLRLHGMSIAGFSLNHRQMKYHFVDPEGNYRGGCIDSLIVNRTDNMTIVFYDVANPDRNIPASALVFHKLVWTQQQPDVEEKTAPGSA